MHDEAPVCRPGLAIGTCEPSWLGWRWCFFIGVPFTLAAIVLLQRTLHLPLARKDSVKIDYLGAAL